MNIQGLSIIKPDKKSTEFSLFVPTFFSSKGTYTWLETYETTLNGKKEVFMKTLKTIVVKVVE